MSLIARHLEAAGIPTVIMGCARDIVEEAGVPRLYYSEFPLGNSAGKPHDEASQRQTLDGALQMFSEATSARTTVRSEQSWDSSDTWQEDFMNIDKLPAEKIEQLKREFAEHKHIANQIKRSG